MFRRSKAVMLTLSKWSSSRIPDREDFMIPRRSIQTNEAERMPKNFPALQERMDTVKRSGAEKQQLVPRPPIENPVGLDKDDNFFLL